MQREKDVLSARTEGSDSVYVKITSPPSLIDSGTALAVRPDGSPNDPRPHGVRLSVWSCGPVMALIDDVPTCKELIEGTAHLTRPIEVRFVTPTMHNKFTVIDYDDLNQTPTLVTESVEQFLQDQEGEEEDQHQTLRDR